jgi:hypothetical protein
MRVVLPDPDKMYLPYKCNVELAQSVVFKKVCGLQFFSELKVVFFYKEKDVFFSIQYCIILDRLSWRLSRLRILCADRRRYTFACESYPGKNDCKSRFERDNFHGIFKF